MSKFITFEGGEGCGKSTQAKKLYKHLLKKGEKAILTREPGGTDFAEKLRSEILLSGDGISDPLTEFLIISAARKDHVDNLIKPKLKDGYTVICDRFFDSSLAYQSYFKGLSAELMHKIHDLTLSGFQPDLTIFLDIDLETAKSRVSSRGKMNHYDSKGDDFSQIISEAFRDIASKNPERFTKIDASESIDEIFAKILKTVDRNR